MALTSAQKDFSRTTLAGLRRRGIQIVGSTWLPDEKGDFARGQRGYLLDDNGTGRVRTFLEVMALSVEEPKRGKR